MLERFKHLQLPFLVWGFLAGIVHPVMSSQPLEIHYRVDPFTRFIRITFPVPASAPGSIDVKAEVRPAAGGEWFPARVGKYRSATAVNLCPADVWNEEMDRGMIREYRAAGLKRTLIWMPYPEFEIKGMVAAVFRITLKAGRRVLGIGETKVTADNSDVVYLNDWGDVLQKDFVTASPKPGEARWWVHSGIGGPQTPILGDLLDVFEKNRILPKLTSRLNLRGPYAIFVSVPDSLSAVELGLSGDERMQLFFSRKYRQEVFWKCARMDFQNLVIRQPWRTVYEYEDLYRARLDCVKLVPASGELLTAPGSGAAGLRDKAVIGYYEPYSWAFFENVQSNGQIREPLLAFQEAGVDIVDIQIGRLGAKPAFESRNEEPLFWNTAGDPVRGRVPETGNVGRMQQYTNMLQSGLRYAHDFGMRAFANFGAGNSYPGTPLQGDFAAVHPDWHSGAQLRYDIPQVREHMLRFYEEAIEIGADGISIDYCRYPDGQMSAGVCTGFLKRLRGLADQYSLKRGRRIPISVRFPAQGVRHWEWFDYRTWCREELVDFLCPSNLQARHLNFDIRSYRDAVRGTAVKLCPVIDALEWGPSWPGEFLERVRSLYRDGADGVNIYQCDAAAFDGSAAREMVRACASTQALDSFLRAEAERTADISKDIYLKPTHRGKRYNRWERVRFWVDGTVPSEVRVWLDGKPINRFTAPPYWVGSEGYESDRLLEGTHLLKIRARNGRQWLERTFHIEGETND